jgi:hypothetical protein
MKMETVKTGLSVWVSNEKLVYGLTTGVQFKYVILSFNTSLINYLNRGNHAINCRKKTLYNLWTNMAICVQILQINL